MEKNLKPSSWSELPFDLLISVFERLTFEDFHRVKLVCWSWLLASQQFPRKNHTPWLILFPGKSRKNTCILFNPLQKDKLYKIKDFSLGFKKNYCVATCGNWLLMRNRWWNLYMVNLFTQEKINVVPLMTWIYKCSVCVFWIDDKTKDCVVLWGGLGKRSVSYSMNGDTLWKQIPKTWNCIDLVYKDHKLYFLSLSGNFKIFDFSGGMMIPRETFQCNLVMDKYAVTKLVVTVKGDVLKVEKYTSLEFYVYKFYSSGGYKDPELVQSLGDDEAILFDLGVLVDGLKGVKKNLVYYNPHGDSLNKILPFNLKTQELDKLHEFDRSFNNRLYTARWFFPIFE